MDEYGLIKENTPMDDKKVLIGRTTFHEKCGTSDDTSILPKGQLGYVDKTYMNNDDEGKE